MNTLSSQHNPGSKSWGRSSRQMILKHVLLAHVLFWTVTGLLFWGGKTTHAQSSLGDKVNSAAESAKDTVEAGAQAASEKAQSLWRRIEESRLMNRTPDEIVAWVLMGILVGSVSGWIDSFRRERHSPLLHLALGLVGAFLGGVVVRVTQLDFGWGPVLIRYEELLAALVGAGLIVFIIRFWMARWKKKKSAK